GSTGTPKGVAMPHRGLMNLLQWQRSTELHNDANARTLQFAAPGFDVAFQEIFSTLCNGECLVLVDDAVRQDPAELVRFVQAEQIHKLFLPFIALQNFADAAARLDAALPCLAHVVTAGEQLRIGATIRQLFRRAPHVRLHNHYGPTETHVVTALTLDGDADAWPALPSIGRPIANARIYVLDRAGQPVPRGATGEIHIGGDAVARGYLGRPELTAGRFAADPHAADANARLYRTGDLGRWLPDGTIEFQGRNDFQVKIRGFRVEPGEIEATLAACAGVREAVVLARADGAGGHRLVAYFLAHDGEPVSVADLRAELAAALPDHMVPSAFVQLDAFPLTSNGKLDRRALPEPDASAVASRAYEAPQGAIETILAAIWQDLLGIGRVGRDDHFFELGGHSLLVIGLIERLRQRGIAANVRAVFDAPTLAGLAAVLAAPHGNAPADAVPANRIAPDCTAIVPDMLPLIALRQDEIDAIVAQVDGGAANVQDVYPLSPLQEGILFHHLLETTGDAYLLRWVLAFDTRAGLDAFLAALQRVIDRHDILRSAIAWSGLAQPAQVVWRHAPLAIAELEPSPDALDVLLARTDPRGTRIDLARAPLLSASVIADTRGGRWTLALLCHHVVIDHYTIDLILAEVRTILHGDAADLPPPLPYRNFIAQTRSVSADEHAAYFH
ncbi:MAG TPA: AMP-binding protein, partial [Tahibacter sp.]|nr:AMP-binding protein [Tahibacter sp.]